MKKFLVLTYGYVPPTDEIKPGMGWMVRRRRSALDRPREPFRSGHRITKTGRSDLDLNSPSPLAGYCIINADSLADAEALVENMPIIDSVRVYEANSM